MTLNETPSPEFTGRYRNVYLAENYLSPESPPDLSSYAPKQQFLDSFTDDSLSIMDQLARLPEEETEKFFEIIAQKPEEALFSWDFWSRPKQRTPDGNWRIWLILAGRGFGKTRTGAEFVREQVNIGNSSHIALVGPTAATVRDTMIEGESGLLKIYPKE